MPSREIQLSGSEYGGIGWNDEERWAVLTNALEPAEWSVPALLTYHGASHYRPSSILERLIKLGRLTLDDVRDALEREEE